MTDRLAGLVLPDRTRIDEAALPPPAKGKHAAAAKPANAPPPPVRKPSVENGERRSLTDWSIIGCGLVLAGACAVFPWYIFYNQEEFGTKPVAFRTMPADAGAMAQAAIPDLAGKRDTMTQIPPPSLDMQSTGSVPAGGKKVGQTLEDQPFPGEKPGFQLVLVANGRAMVEDENGYWVVQTGSWLPDGSRAASIEKRSGKWVLVTSRDAVVTLAEN